MEFTIQAREFGAVLSRVHGVAGQSTQPSLRDLRITGEGRSATIAAYNGRMAVVCTVPAEVKRPGSGVLAFSPNTAKFLHSLKGEVKLARNTKTIRVTCDSTVVGFEEQGSLEDFPHLPVAKVQYTPVSAGHLLEMVRRTLHAVAKSNNRPALQGAYLHEVDGTHRLVTSDGTRLAILSRPLGKLPIPESGIVVPLDGLVKLQQLLDNCPEEGWEMGTTEETLMLRRPGLHFICSLMGERYVDYQQLLKQVPPGVLTPRKRLLEAVRRVAHVAESGREAWVRLSLVTGKMVVEAHSSELGEARDSFELVGADTGADSTYAYYNPRYLLEVLVAAEQEEVELSITGERDPVIFRTEDGFTAILMPILMPILRETITPVTHTEEEPGESEE